MDNPSTARKFIDLILQASDKWANWNPPCDIKVGDYGKLDEKSGGFNKEGNIYDDTHIYEDQNLLKLVKEHPPKAAAREDVYIAASTTVKHGEFKMGVQAKIPGLEDALIKGQWAFGSKRGALLIMAHPRCFYIPPATLLKHLAEVQALKDMFLVTEAFSCPAYSLYLSSGSKEVVDLALLGSFPVPHTPGVTAGVEIGGKWWVQNASGLFRSGREPSGKDDYTPLYMLKGIRKKKGIFSRREPFSEREGDDIWGQVQVPWDPLNEEGDVVPFEDTVFD